MTRARHNSGFTLLEVLMALVLFGALVAVMIPALNTLDQLQQTGRQHGRTAANVPLQESLIAQGFNPASVEITNVPELGSVRSSSPTLSKSVWSNQPGSYQVWLLNGQTGQGTNQNVDSYGFQLGRGTDAAGRGPVVPATPPIVLGAPAVSPAGPNVALASFVIAPVNPGDPWSIQVVATASDPTNLVRLKFLGVTAHTASGVGSASFNLNAAEIVAGGTLQAWSEFAGTAADTAEMLGDGRTRWWTSTNVYEPSDFVVKAYRVSIGAPSLFINGTPYASGTSIPVTWDMRSAISTASVGYDPADVSKLGGSFGISSYAAQFNAVPIVSAPNVALVFGDAMLPTWTSRNLLSAQPLGLPSGLSATTGSWSLDQSAIALADPELISSPYNGSYVTGGLQSFAAPYRGSTRVGRVRVNETYSFGPVLDVPVNP